MAGELTTRPLPDEFYTPKPLSNWGDDEVIAWRKHHPDIPEKTIRKHIEMAKSKRRKG